MLPHENFYQKPEHGNPVILIDVHKHAQNMMARPLYHMLRDKPTLDYHYFWCHSLHDIANHHGMFSINDILRMHLPPAKRTNDDSTHLQVARALESLQAMKIIKIAPPDFYSAATTPMFYNEEIRQPTPHGTAPFTYTGVYERLRHKVRYLIDLVSCFNTENYRTRGRIGRCTLLSPASLSTRFRTPGMPPEHGNNLLMQYRNHY